MGTQLTPPERALLEALGDVVVPQALADTTREGFLAQLDARVLALPHHVRGELRRALTALDHPVARLFLGTGFGGWRAMPLASRERAFAALATSRFPIARTLYQAVRRLLVTAWYSTEAAQRQVGVIAPLHTRAPAFDWEGPLAHASGDVVASGDRSRPPAAPTSVDHPRMAITLGGDLRGSFRFRADAIVIGSGAGGALAAARLAEAGREVLILEAGSWFDRTERTEDEAAMYPRLMADAGARASTDLSLAVLQGATVGGSTSVNWMIMLRTPDHVLDEWRRRFGLPDLSPAALRPEFDRIERELAVGAVPDDAHSPSNQLLLSGARQLGWHASGAQINARLCQRAGTCTLGCRYDARQGAAQVYLPMAFTRGARLLANTRAERIRVIERDAGQGNAPRKVIEAVTVDPHTGEVVGSVIAEAPVVVVAAGAIDTPALLQRSALGGPHVGRWLRVHPTTAVMGVYPQETYPLAGIPLSAMCDAFASEGDHGYGFWIECPAFGPSLAAAAMPGIGAAHQARMQAIRHTAPFIALTRDGAALDRSSGSVQVGRDGAPRIRYRLTDADARTVRASLVAAARIHLAAGATSAFTLHARPVEVRGAADVAAIERAPIGPNQLGLFTAHVAGTCRMGVDPRQAAVAPSGELFGTRGLYVADGSLLPTAPGVNPQETIYALASHVAARIISSA